MPKKNKLSRQFISLRVETHRYNRRRGLYTRVAQQLSLSPAHVRNVAMGLRRSARVEQALELALRERAA